MMVPEPQPAEASLPLSAIILAGGQSSRMGHDKALITLEGVPLLRRTCDLVLQCTSEVYVVTSWPQRYQDLLPKACKLIREVPLPGQAGPQGPLVGFSQGLAYVKTDWVMLLACDLPQLQIETLQSWVRELKTITELTIARGESEIMALLPRHAKGWEPLCGFYRRSCLPALTKFINQGDRSFQQWLGQTVVQELPVADAQVLFNCNTPDDLALFRKSN